MVPFGAVVSLRRFLVPPESLGPGQVELPPAEAAHAQKVLRLKPGDKVILIDGSGRRGQGELVSLGRGRALCRVTRVEEIPRLKPRLVICPGLIKGPAMDLLAVKLSELSVDEVRPMLTGRSVVRAPDAGAKLARWERLAGQALKQCGAGYPPRFHPPAPLGEVAGQAPAEAAKILLYEAERQKGLAEELAACKESEVWVLVGPEGGFAAEEAALALGLGFVSRGLPGPVLRAETACLAAASLVRFGLRG